MAAADTRVVGRVGGEQLGTGPLVVEGGLGPGVQRPRCRRLNTDYPPGRMVEVVTRFLEALGGDRGQFAIARGDQLFPQQHLEGAERKLRTVVRPPSPR